MQKDVPLRELIAQKKKNLLDQDYFILHVAYNQFNISSICGYECQLSAHRLLDPKFIFLQVNHNTEYCKEIDTLSL